VDAKKTLAELKGWAQKQGYGQFSNQQLAKAFESEEIPDEVQVLAQQLRKFVDV
jgi:hypothetical protein